MKLKKLRQLLENDNHDYREKLKLLFSDPIYIPRLDLSIKDQKDLAYKRLRKLFQAGLVDLQDFEKDPRRIFALHEMCAMVDGSFVTKLTVQANLFGGTVIKFANREQWQWLIDKANKLDAVGCFALTELGFGNNAVEMETEANYNIEDKTFTIHSPSTLSQKYWITNGYCHAHWAVVFAQLKVGGQSHGVHAFLVRIREDDLTQSQGVTIQDMGAKFGLNGVDNARLWFDNVKVPRENLLSSFANIDDAGHYRSPISGKRNRFLKMADQLLSGRLCIASMSMSAAKMSLLITLRYSQKRRAMGSDGKSSWPLINFQLQRNALMPLLARTYALAFALNKVKNSYSFAEASKEQVINCCVIKALVTWHAENTVTVCRERCGGQGYLAANMFAELLAGAHAGMTAEGDNAVLMQKVAKELISDISALDLMKLKGASLFSLHSVGKGWELKDCLHLFEKREDIHKSNLAIRMQKANWKSKEKVFTTWMVEESNTVQALSKSFGERYTLKAFQEILADKEFKDPVVEKLAKLFALDCIKNDLGFFLTEGLLSRSQAKDLDTELSKLCADICPFTSYLLDAFGIPEHLIHAPIARDYVSYNLLDKDNRGEVLKIPSVKKRPPSRQDMPSLNL